MKSYYEKTNDAAAVLIELTRDCPVMGQVRLQKLSYLLQASGMKRIQGFFPLIRAYGPYSEFFAGALRLAIGTGLIRESIMDYEDEGQNVSYSLDTNHPDASYLTLEAEEVAQVKRVLDLTYGMDWRALELAATARFLGLEKALSLKPLLLPHKNTALRLLNCLIA